MHINGLPRGNPTEARDANVTGQRMLASLEQGAARSSVGQMALPRQSCVTRARRATNDCAALKNKPAITLSTDS
jgi:hypothetical protein